VKFIIFLIASFLFTNCNQTQEKVPVEKKQFRKFDLNKLDTSIISRSELNFLLSSINNKKYSKQDIDKFTEITYFAFSNPQHFDDKYAKFLIDYFGDKQKPKPFPNEAASQIMRDKPFFEYYKARKNDVEYFGFVIDWCLMNLDLLYYADDDTDLEFCFNRICKSNKVDTIIKTKTDTYESYISRVNKNFIKQQNKKLLVAADGWVFIACDINSSEKVTSILSNINWKFIDFKW